MDINIQPMANIKQFISVNTNRTIENIINSNTSLNKACDALLEKCYGKDAIDIFLKDKEEVYKTIFNRYQSTLEDIGIYIQNISYYSLFIHQTSIKNIQNGNKLYDGKTLLAGFLSRACRLSKEILCLVQHGFPNGSIMLCRQLLEIDEQVILIKELVKSNSFDHVLKRVVWQSKVADYSFYIRYNKQSNDVRVIDNISDFQIELDELEIVGKKLFENERLKNFINNMKEGKKQNDDFFGLENTLRMVQKLMKTM